jgi:hypothetical protein
VAFRQAELPESIERLISKLNIDKSRPHCYKYYLAQAINIYKSRAHCYKHHLAEAIANLDRYIVTDEFNPPMMDDKFTFAIDLKEGEIVEKCKPQTFTEVQKKFLTAKTYLLQLTNKIELRNFNLNPGDWNSRIMLEHLERNGEISFFPKRTRRKIMQKYLHVYRV